MNSKERRMNAAIHRALRANERHHHRHLELDRLMRSVRDRHHNARSLQHISARAMYLDQRVSLENALETATKANKGTGYAPPTDPRASKMLESLLSLLEPV